MELSPTATVADEIQEQESEVKDGAAGGTKGKIEREVQEIPKNNLWVVFTGLILCTFLAALDQTVVSTALPTIVREIGQGASGSSGYSWVGVAYFLTSTCLIPFYGKVSNIYGRKVVLYFAITVFLFGSAMCGAAQSMTWLCVCRGVQGIGGGGIISLVQITISDIVPLAKRGTYGGIIGATYGIASLLGPLIGGLLTDKISWRWVFFINLPTGGFAFAILVTQLNLNPHKAVPLSILLKTFDFFGLFLIISGVVLLLVGFNFGETSFNNAPTIVLLALGGLILVLAAVWECKTTRSQIIPPRLFRTRTTACLLLSVYCHANAFITASYFLPLYFQIRGSSATTSGIQLMPFSFGAAVVFVVTGIILAKTKKYRAIISISFALCVIGFSLLATLDENSNAAMEELYLLICALGVGALFQVPLVALQAAMPISDMATATATLSFIRSLGGTTGISIGGAIYGSEVNKRLSFISGYTAPDGNAFAGNVSGLHLLEPIELRQEVLHAYTRSLSTIWFLAAPILFCGFVLSLFLRHYSLERTIVRTGGKEDGAVDATGKDVDVDALEMEKITTDEEEGKEEKEKTM